MTYRPGPAATGPASGAESASADQLIRRRLMAFVTRYPATTFVGAPYLLVIVPMALWNHNPQILFILRLLGLALAGTVAVEGLLPGGGGPSREDWESRLRLANAGFPRGYLIARVVAVISMIAEVVGVLAGRGTVATQVSGQVATSPAASLSSLVSGWGYLAFGLLIAAYLGGTAKLRGVWLWTGLMVATQVYVVSLTAILAPLVGFLSVIIAVGALFGLVKARQALALTIIAFLLWPTVYEARNEIRVTQGVAVQQSQTAIDRIRFDQQLSELSRYEVPADLGQPGPITLLRYGLLPRFLDPGRPALSTGEDINVYIGGSRNSAHSFLGIGTVYFLNGSAGVLIYFAGWALALTLLLRWRGVPGPGRLGLLCFVFGGPLLWSSTYPDSISAFLQFTVSSIPVLIALWATRATRVTPDPAARPPSQARRPDTAGHAASASRTASASRAGTARHAASASRIREAAYRTPAGRPAGDE